MFKYTQNLGPVSEYFPSRLSSRDIKGRLKKLSHYNPLSKKRSKDVSAKRRSEDVVVPLFYIRDSSGHYKWGVSERSYSEKVLSGKRASFMEKKTFSEKLKERIKDRIGKEGETLVDVSYRCCHHEAWNDFDYKDFKKIAPYLLKLKAACEYKCTPKDKKKYKISVLIFEQTMELPYSPNKDEISRIDLVTSEELQKTLYNQADVLVDAEPSGDRKNLKLIVDKVVDPVTLANQTWDFDPYTKDIRLVKQEKAEGVLAIPPTRNGLTYKLLKLYRRVKNVRKSTNRGTSSQ
jgi:hypothetical protein